MILELQHHIDDAHAGGSRCAPTIDAASRLAVNCLAQRVSKAVCRGAS